VRGLSAQPVGEDVAALRVGAKLHLVNGQEIRAHALWHCLDGADPIGGAVGHDALLAGDQGHHRGAADGHYFVVDLAREQAQGQPDDARAVGEHSLDGVVGFAGVGGAKNRCDACLLTHSWPFDVGAACAAHGLDVLAGDFLFQPLDAFF